MHIKRAERLDPKSVATTPSGRVHATATCGGYAEALAAHDRILAMSPANLGGDSGQGAAADPARGHGRRQTHVADALTHVDSTALAIRFAYYQEMMWVLDPPLLAKDRRR